MVEYLTQIALSIGFEQFNLSPGETSKRSRSFGAEIRVLTVEADTIAMLARTW
jgi:hypothetical protein